MSKAVPSARNTKPATKTAPQLLPQPKRPSLPRSVDLSLNLIVSAAYIFMVWLLAFRHEPWFDEAQGWLIARDCSLADLFLRVTHYEGSPALWHLLLMIPAKLGLPYLSLNLIAAAFASAVLVLIWFSPLPIWLRLLLPFTFFSLFQYAIIARNYVLIPLLIYLAALSYPTRRTKTVRYLLVLILLANVSLHGSLIAGGILALDLAQNLLGWRRLDRQGRNRLILKGAGLFAMVTLVVLQALPAPDISAVKQYHWDIVYISQTAWRMLNNSFSERAWVTIPVLLVSLVWFWRRGVLWIYVVPVILLSALFGIKWSSEWHEGTLLYVWLYALWLSFYGLEDRGRTPAASKATSHRRGLGLMLNRLRTLKAAMLLAAGLVLTIHIYWGACAWYHHMRGPLSGSKAAAAVIREHAAPGKQVWVDYWPSFSLQPYFKHNAFANYQFGGGGALLAVVNAGVYTALVHCR